MVYEYYDVDNFNSIDGKYWGKHGWIFLNSIALTYNSDNKEEYLKFFNQLQYILPCEKCREHYKKNILTLNNFVLQDKDTLLKWLMDIRNSINIENNRPIITREETINEIFEKNDYNYFKFYKILFLITLIMFLILLFLYLKN
jgi:hypothetical protein